MDTENATLHPVQGTLWSADRIRPIADQLRTVLHDMTELEARYAELLAGIPNDRRASARNLLHYVALRRHDLRGVQEELARRGLSSFQTGEAYALANVRAVVELLERPLGGGGDLPSPPTEFPASRGVLARATERLFGLPGAVQRADIMVTMPTEAATHYDLVRRLVTAGMDVARINCAHDDESAWAGMIAHVRRAAEDTGRRCRIAMDLAGPKLRTGAIEPGPCVVKWRPKRDSIGRTVAPATIWFGNEAEWAEPPTAADAYVPVEGRWLDDVAVGDQIQLKDARDQNRLLRVVGRSAYGVWTECNQTTYVVPGLALRLRKEGHSARRKAKEGARKKGKVGALPALEQALTLYKGDRLVLDDGTRPGAPALYDDAGRIVRAARIGFTMPEVFPDLREGERILFDDGKIEGVIEQARPDHLVVEILTSQPRGERLRADKGINLPDSTIRLPALTPTDIEDLAFVARHADIVNYSFVRRIEDLDALRAELDRRGRPDIGVVLKIENQQAFQRLPRLLLHALRSPVSGVMIARGDLAVECGWRRLAEVQEEILCMCEAAHMPVVWATQVLEGLAKSGLPSRAEITDAAQSVRAECVMLNKGAHIVEAVKALDDILRRMGGHRDKRRTALRRLHIADDLLPVE